MFNVFVSVFFVFVCLCRASLIVMLLVSSSPLSCQPPQMSSSPVSLVFSFPDNLPRKITAVRLIRRRSCIFTTSSVPLLRAIPSLSNLISSPPSLRTRRSWIFSFSFHFCFFSSSDLCFNLLTSSLIILPSTSL